MVFTKNTGNMFIYSKKDILLLLVLLLFSLLILNLGFIAAYYYADYSSKSLSLTDKVDSKDNMLYYSEIHVLPGQELSLHLTLTPLNQTIKVISDLFFIIYRVNPENKSELTLLLNKTVTSFDEEWFFKPKDYFIVIFMLFDLDNQTYNQYYFEFSIYFHGIPNLLFDIAKILLPLTLVFFLTYLASVYYSTIDLRRKIRRSSNNDSNFIVENKTSTSVWKLLFLYFENIFYSLPLFYYSVIFVVVELIKLMISALAPRGYTAPLFLNTISPFNFALNSKNHDLLYSVFYLVFVGFYNSHLLFQFVMIFILSFNFVRVENQASKKIEHLVFSLPSTLKYFVKTTVVTLVLVMYFVPLWLFNIYYYMLLDHGLFTLKELVVSIFLISGGLFTLTAFILFFYSYRRWLGNTILMLSYISAYLNFPLDGSFSLIPLIQYFFLYNKYEDLWFHGDGISFYMKLFPEFVNLRVMLLPLFKWITLLFVFHFIIYDVVLRSSCFKQLSTQVYVFLLNKFKTILEKNKIDKVMSNDT